MTKKKEPKKQIVIGHFYKNSMVKRVKKILSMNRKISKLKRQLQETKTGKPNRKRDKIFLFKFYQ